MEICVTIFGVFYTLIQGVLLLILMLVIFPYAAIKIAAKFNLKSFNWVAIAAGIYGYIGLYILTNKNYREFFINLLPAMSCGMFIS
jgi:hypothetical protein